MTATPRPVTEIQIGGNAYRVQSSAEASELAHLVEIVETRLAELSGPRRTDSRSLVLVALSLAHDLEHLRREHAALRLEVTERLTSLVGRIDDVLDHRDEKGELLAPIPPADTPEPVPASPTEQPDASLATSGSNLAVVARRGRATAARAETTDAT